MVLGLPMLLLMLCGSLASDQSLTQIRDLDAIEFFAGRAYVTDALRMQGLTVAPYEIDMDGRYGRGMHDLCSTRGFIYAVQLVRRYCVASCMPSYL